MKNEERGKQEERGEQEERGQRNEADRKGPFALVRRAWEAARHHPVRSTALVVVLVFVGLVLRDVLRAREEARLVAAKDKQVPLERMESIRVIRVLARQSCRGARGLQLPIETIAAGLLRKAGFEVAGRESDAYDATFRVEVSGRVSRVTDRKDTSHFRPITVLHGTLLLTALGEDLYGEKFGVIITPLSSRPKKPRMTAREVQALLDEQLWGVTYDDVSYGTRHFVPAFVQMIAARWGAAKVEPLLTSEYPVVRAYVAHVLGSLRSPSSVLPLIEAMKDESAETRREAANALGMIADQRAAQALAAACSDENEQVARAAKDACDRLPQ